MLAGLNHVTILTGDLDRLAGFYEDVFGARKLVELPVPDPDGPGRHALIDVGGGASLHAFELERVPSRHRNRCSSAGASTILP